MKTSKVILLSVGVLLAGAVLLGRSLGQDQPGVVSPGRVAVCDVVQVFNNYARANDLTATLNERRQSVKAENEKRIQAIDALGLELEGLMAGSKEYEQRFNEIQRLGIERQAWLQYQETLVMRDHHRLTKEMYQEVLGAVAAVAKQQGFQVVIYRKLGELESENTVQLRQEIELRKVLYADEAIDLTDVVLKRLNDTYRTTKNQ